MPALKTFLYENPPFSTRLPLNYRFTRFHFWADKVVGGRLRVGFTQFATRTLGEIVDYNFDTAAQTKVLSGQVLGWIEGFKGISDVLSAGSGVFLGENPSLKQDTELITRATYTEGWLYEIEGELDSESLSAQEYARHLDAIIKQLRAKPHSGGDE